MYAITLGQKRIQANIGKCHIIDKNVLTINYQGKKSPFFQKIEKNDYVRANVSKYKQIQANISKYRGIQNFRFSTIYAIYAITLGQNRIQANIGKYYIINKNVLTINYQEKNVPIFQKIVKNDYVRANVSKYKQIQANVSKYKQIQRNIDFPSF